MVIKIVTLFLIAMAVLAMFGRLRFGGGRRSARRRPPVIESRKCPDCGAYVIGDGPCACKERRS
ncbi:MAG: hypothetical protein D6832_01510, partial [Alphaproteobacteria bacterium]